jgi:hypothetical protein
VNKKPPFDLFRFRQWGILLTMSIITLLAKCTRCKCVVNQTDLYDEDDEDCNAWEALKSYRLIQQGRCPNRCLCGEILQVTLVRKSQRKKAIQIQFGKN